MQAFDQVDGIGVGRQNISGAGGRAGQRRSHRQILSDYVGSWARGESTLICVVRIGSQKLAAWKAIGFGLRRDNTIVQGFITEFHEFTGITAHFKEDAQSQRTGVLSARLFHRLGLPGSV
jgi:hypothetical protein